MSNNIIYILYTGIGSNGKRFHTELEFLRIMEREFTNKLWYYELNRMREDDIHEQLEFKDWILPDEFIFFTLEDWLEYSGARIVSSNRNRNRNKRKHIVK